jgi:hypothetical protein
MSIQELLALSPSVLALANLFLMLYTLTKFIKKPHDSLNDRVTALEVEVKELKTIQRHDNKKYRELIATIEVIIKSTLALIEFEIQYCLTENKQPTKELEDAKVDLHRFLSKRSTSNDEDY